MEHYHVTLVERVEAYLERIKEAHPADDPIQSYPLGKVAVWEIVAGYREDSENERKTLARPYVKGSFIDAIAFAVQQPEFYCADEEVHDVKDSVCGHVRLARSPLKLKKTGIEDLINQRKKLAKKSEAFTNDIKSRF
jgi:hypothetical protein